MYVFLLRINDQDREDGQYSPSNTYRLKYYLNQGEFAKFAKSILDKRCGINKCSSCQKKKILFMFTTRRRINDR